MDTYKGKLYSEMTDEERRQAYDALLERRHSKRRSKGEAKSRARARQEILDKSGIGVFPVGGVRTGTFATHSLMSSIFESQGTSYPSNWPKKNPKFQPGQVVEVTKSKHGSLRDRYKVWEGRKVIVTDYKKAEQSNQTFYKVFDPENKKTRWIHADVLESFTSDIYLV